MTQNPKFPLTAVFVKDKEDGGYTGFFMEVPGAVAEGDSKEEVEANLMQSLLAMFKFNKKEREISQITNGYSQDVEGYETETFNFELS